MKPLYVVALAALTVPIHAQQSELVIRGGTQEVLLDFVVRDKHQKLVKGVRPEDVQIFEDGVLQKPRSFVFRDGRSLDTTAANAAAGSNALHQSAADPLRQINLVTLVFEGMSPVSRRTAVERAHEFLKAETGANTWMAVYSLRYQLSVQQPYTTDLALLNKAVDLAGTGAYQQFAKENLNIIQRINSLQAYGAAATTFQPLDPGSAEERGPQNDPGLAGVEIAIQQLIIKTLFRQEGARSIDALRTLIREQARLPGRKTILFFSEGLVIPPDQPEILDAVIAEANRSNVTFYTVDSRGLTVVSNLRLSQATSAAIQGAEHGGAPSVLQTDLQANARHLAEGTGGFAMDNSNDLRGPLQRVMEDVRSHYEVTYAPASENFDGHFRKLEVRLSIPGLKVQSRAGYYALPLVSGETIAPYELGALNAINREPAPYSFPYTAAALRFGEDPAGINCFIVFAVPGSSLHFTNDPAANSFQIHISVLGLVKDERGRVVAKVANDLPFRAPVDKQANFAEGKVTLTLPVHLRPGRYQLQTAVLDREADRASVKRSVLIVPAAPQVSDLVWVRSVEAPNEDIASILDTPQGRITPELSPLFAQSDSAEFYFAAFTPARPQAEMVVARDGKVLAKIALATPPDETWPYRYTGTLPLSQLEPGQYEVVVTVTQNSVASRTQSLFEVRESK